MRIGSIGRCRVNILKDSSADGDEAPVYTGENFATSVPAEIESVSGQETYRGRQLEAGVNYVVRMRYLAGLLPTMRVVPADGPFNALTFDVRYVQNLPYRRGHTPETWLYCGDAPAV